MIIEFSPAVETTLYQLAEQQGKTAEQIVAQIVMKNLPNIQSSYIQPSYAKGDFNFDLERMKEAVNAPRAEIPKEAMKDLDSFDAWIKGAFA